MTDESIRKPASFKLKPESVSKREKARKTAEAKPAKTARKPRAIKSNAKALVVPATDDPFDLPDTISAPPRPSKPVRRKSWLGRLFLVTAGLLVSMAIGLWLDSLIRDLFSRADWLGWAAAGLAGVAGLCLFIILIREIAAIFRLRSITRIKSAAEQAYADDDAKHARSVIRDLTGLLSEDPATAAARKNLAELSNDIIDGRDLLGLAETELLRPIDNRARQLILSSAKRVSVVTAVSPRALVDVGFVLFESGRLVRRISELYGGRPGTAGFLRLTSRVAGHLAITGSIAIGETLVQQLIGQGLAARLSSRLGEGVVNGLMTARIGIAAMDVVRPLAFHREKRPGIGDFLSDLARFSGQDDNGQTDKKNTI